VAEALDYASQQLLPPPSLVFPWLHGLHPENQTQRTFFDGHQCSLGNTPNCLRAITIVKADGNLSFARLKGAIAPGEFMRPGATPEFIDADPLSGLSVRNFHIQPAKVAATSDIIVYGLNPDENRRVAWRVAVAQKRWRDKQHSEAKNLPKYNTFVCTSPFSAFEENHKNLVSIDVSGNPTGQVLDLTQQERQEMRNMTEVSEICHNVFLGPSPEPGSVEEQHFDVLIECSDTGRLDPSALQFIAEHPFQSPRPSSICFPSSGSIMPPTWSQGEADGIIDTCKWIYDISHNTVPETSDPLQNGSPHESPTIAGTRKVLIHCPDGYTESTLLAIAYFSYATGLPIPDAWLKLHTTKRRNFFAYPSDVSLLSAIGPRLLCESPVSTGKSLDDITNITRAEPLWFSDLDGSLPSRILDYLYLGNLVHANNPDLLRQLNIHQILSIGESATWTEEDREKWGLENICFVEGIQDNGIDPLTKEFARCLEFIGKIGTFKNHYCFQTPKGISCRANQCYRSRNPKRHVNFSSLPSRSFQECYYLHSGGYAGAQPLISSRLLFCQGSPSQRHHSASFTFCI
jgi:dual specificity MAP kinase phosphatase